MGPTPRLIRPRVVFDTNVLVSALLFRRGLLGWLVDVWHTERVRRDVFAKFQDGLASLAAQGNARTRQD